MIKFKFGIITLLGCILLISCEDFLEIETPHNKIVSETVFKDDETAISTVTGIYNELFNADFSNGYISSVTVLAGMSSDIFQMRSETDNRYGPFNQNQISPNESPDATANYNLWSSAYNIIYMTNSVLEGLDKSTSVSQNVRTMLTGQALFIRAFAYFYLTNLYGDVPLVLSTDYRENSRIERSAHLEVLKQIESDLELSRSLLKGVEDHANCERTRVSYFVVLAFSARTNLYLQNWEKAEEYSNEIIDQTSQYEILKDLNEVFLANSREAIWQLSPIGRGNILTYTWEGYVFRGNNSSTFQLSDDFLESLEPDDQRLSHWIAYNSSRNFYYPYKYKDRTSINNISEYSMVLRLSEQYLIRAEARAMQDKLSEAVLDMDVLRQRANIDLLSDTNPIIGKEELLKAILDERKRELFGEWGHRWLDLKRTGKVNEVLQPIKPFWQETDIWFPIPGEERAKNSNLSQNEGY